MPDDVVEQVINNAGPDRCPMCGAEVGYPHDEECLRLAKNVINKALLELTGEVEGYSPAAAPTSQGSTGRVASALIGFICVLLFGVPLSVVWYQIVLDLVEWKGFVK